VATNILFYDNDGQPVGLGEQVHIEFIVIGARKIKDDDPYLTVTLKLKHNPEGMKFKIDSGSELHTAPSNIIVR